MISQSRHSMLVPLVTGTTTRRTSEGRTSLQDSLFAGPCSQESEGHGASGGGSTFGAPAGARERGGRPGADYTSFASRNFADPQWAETVGQTNAAGNSLAAKAREKMLQSLPKPRFPFEPSLNSERGVYQKSFSVLSVHRWLSEWC